ncbi:MAG: hypothetical protein HYX93_02145 [Chloroflexi bacterium]|nr:hypothetical protein [Chloroflexota bacterium]
MGTAVRRAAAIAVVLVVVFTIPQSATGHGTIVIEGRVVNGTEGADVPHDLTISLDVLQAGQRVEGMETVTDAGGRFTFGEVRSEEDFLYIISTEYAGAPYMVQGALSVLQEPVELAVYESTGSTETLHVRGHTLVVNAADSRDRVMNSLELVTLENSGDRTFVPDIARDGPMSLLRFSLPDGATALDVQSSLSGGQLIQVDVGFAISAPVPPGSHEIIYAYRSPYDGGKKSFSHSFPFGADTFRVLVLDGVGKARGPGLELMEPLVLGERGYQRLEAHDLGAGTALTVELFGLPRPSLWQRWTDIVSGKGFARVVIPATFGLALLALMSYVLTRQNRTTVAYQGALPSGQRSELLEAMAQMDDRFQRGELEEEDYIRERQALKERLLRLESVVPSADSSESTGGPGSLPASSREKEEEG